MKLRSTVVLLVLGAFVLNGCGDDITNIIEEVGPTAVPPTAVPPTDTPTPGPTTVVTPPSECGPPEAGVDVVCGDGICHTPEQCDVGGVCAGGANNGERCSSLAECPDGTCAAVGGAAIPDEATATCSANCTIETVRTADFAPGTSAIVQTTGFAVPVALTGSQTFRTGAARADDTVGLDGEVTFRANDLPVVSGVDDLRIDPAIVPSLVCACVRGVEVPAFGPNNSLAGFISCNERVDNIDYVLEQDHRTDPLEGFAVNPDCSLPADPDCNDVVELTDGVSSAPCREGAEPECSLVQEDPDDPIASHPGVCNSGRNLLVSGDGPEGSAFMFINIAIGLLSDAGSCNMDIANQSPCPEPSYGPDCIPCTADDDDLGVPQTNPITTGTARAQIYNAINIAGGFIAQGSSTPCTDDTQCGSTCGAPETCIQTDPMDSTSGVCSTRCGGSRCITVQQGQPFDCDGLLNTDTGGLSGGSLAVSFPAIDSNLIGDNTTGTVFSYTQPGEQ